MKVNKMEINDLRNLKIKTLTLLRLNNYGWDNLKIFCDIWDINESSFFDYKSVNDKTEIIVLIRAKMRKFEIENKGKNLID